MGQNFFGKQLACEKLHRERIVRPGVTRLERFVATAREQAHAETFRLLTPLLTDERKTLLDGLLQPNATTGRTLLSWLRQEAISHAASHIIATLTKIVFLQDAGVDQWDLSCLNPNRAKWLAQIGWKSTNQYLQRMAPERRYPVLVAFLEDRRRVMRQLNKGEALHDLRAYLMIANKGQLRRKRGDELVNQASCLNLVTNAVIVWNTVYMAAAVAQLKREGYPVTESDLAHIWPTRYEHINVYGRYHFNIEEAQRREGLRPLRSSAGNIP